MISFLIGGVIDILANFYALCKMAFNFLRKTCTKKNNLDILEK